MDKARPIYKALPSVYSRYASTEYLTDSAYLVEYFERAYNHWQSQLDSFLIYDESFANFSDSQLDALAPFFGFTYPFYSKGWSRYTKIKLFQGVFRFPHIFRFRGSQIAFDYVVEALQIKAKLTKPDGFIAGISIAGMQTAGAAPTTTLKIVYPSTYIKGSEEFAKIEYLRDYWIPLQVKKILSPTEYPL